ncbi:MAG: RNA polymerase sigma factor [Bacteroidales bacterium]
MFCNVLRVRASYGGMEEKTEAYYLEQIRSGNKDAFRWIVDQYKDMIYTLSLRMLGQEADAEEATQDVFVKAYRALDGFQGEARLATWLYRITYNHCISVIRRKVRVIDLVDEVPDGEVDEGDLSGLELLTRDERTRFVRQALEALPETDAVIVTLFYFDESSIEEIVDVTGLSSGNVRIRLHRSRKKLYQVLKEQLKTEIKSLV